MQFGISNWCGDDKYWYAFFEQESGEHIYFGKHGWNKSMGDGKGGKSNYFKSKEEVTQALLKAAEPACLFSALVVGDRFRVDNASFTYQKIHTVCICGTAFDAVDINELKLYSFASSSQQFYKVY